MKKNPIKHQIDGLIALLLFGVFSVCILAVLLTGADAYRRLTDRDRAAFTRRVSLQYIATRVRQADTLGGVQVQDFCGLPALVLAGGPDESEGYITRVYYYDGAIRELYAFEELEMTPESGELILTSDPLEFSMEDGRLTVTSGEDRLVLSLRSGEGAAG